MSRLKELADISPDGPELPGVAVFREAEAQSLATEPVPVIQRIVDVSPAPAPGDADIVLTNERRVLRVLTNERTVLSTDLLALRVPDVCIIGAHCHRRPGGAGGEGIGHREISNSVLIKI